MFGFVNVFFASVFAFSQHNNPELLEQILVCDDEKMLEFGETALVFGDKAVSREGVGRVRETKAISFGSCSFSEPTTELRDLGWSISAFQ